MGDIHALWNQYLQEEGVPTATQFGVWLIQRCPKLVLASGLQRQGHEEADHHPTFGFDALDISTRAAILINRMQRFLHMQTKHVMKYVGISNDEFVVLATLLYAGKATKTALLRQCLIEIPTGSELLKRMKQAGYVLEKANREDGRSSVIAISARGKQVLFMAFEQLAHLEDALSALPESEKLTLLHILEKLDLHHSSLNQVKQVRAIMEQSPTH